MWALGKRGWPGGLPLVGEEGGAQLWELAFRLEPAEALGGLEHGGGGPTQAIEASRQRLTLRQTRRTDPSMFSMMLVQARIAAAPSAVPA